MIIDCHYHLEPRVQTEDNLLSKMDQNQIEKTVLMAAMCDPIPHNPEFLLKLMRFLLTHRTLHPLVKKLAARFTPDGNLILPKNVLEIYRDPNNQPVAEAIAAHPDRFLGWIFVNPRGQNDPVDEFEKWSKEKGFVGVKAHPFWHRYPPLELLPVAEKAAAAGLPMLLHVGFDDHGDFLSLVDRVPELKLILAHTGFPGYSHTWEAIRNRSNIWVDVSADAYVNEACTRGAVERLGADRCLFGTDGPYGREAEDGFFDNGYIKRRLEELFPDEATRKKMLGENVSALIA